jgi:hypothetical protein
MPVSDSHQADASANQSARVERLPYLVSAPDQPVKGRRKSPGSSVAHRFARKRHLARLISLPRHA